MRRLVALIPVLLLGACAGVGSTIPPDKQAQLDTRDTALAVASAANAASGVTKADDPGLPTGPADTGMILTPHLAAGAGTIFESTDPAPGSDALVTNRWYEDKGNSDFVSVFAGRDAMDPTAGLVLVTYGMPRDLRRFDAPSRHGALRIVGAHGEVLTVLAADGYRYSLDVAALRFE